MALEYFTQHNLNSDPAQPISNAANIHAITTHINTSTTQLNNKFDLINQDLDKKFNQTMASQAALANLFQPYKVGKLNLTAAVGGYKSSNAVAVGTGYRFNEKVAVRASASFIKGGSVSYGAGINFEY